MSRGIDEEEAKKMIILSNFNKIIEEIKDDSIQNELIEIINDRI